MAQARSLALQALISLIILHLVLGHYESDKTALNQDNNEISSLWKSTFLIISVNIAQFSANKLITIQSVTGILSIYLS